MEKECELVTVTRLWLKAAAAILGLLIAVGIPSCTYKQVKEIEIMDSMVKDGADPIHAAIASRGMSEMK